jgi:hypothetical protein
VRALVLLGAAVAVAFVSLMLLTTGGHFVAQVPDLYVVAQYARAMAEGHPFRYNAGDAPTTGSTSLLETAIFAVAHALGARGEGLVAFAILFGALLLLASIPLAARIATRLASPREGLLAGALVALGGPVVWSYLYGSDIALFLFLALLLLDRWLAWWAGGSGTALAVAAALVALARPEGLVLGAILGAASLLRRPPPEPRARRLLPWAGLGTALAVLALQRAVTGSWLGTSMSGKSLVAAYGPVEALSIASKYGVDVLRGLLLGFYPAEAPIGFWAGEAPFAFPPLGLVLLLLAVPTAPALLRRGAAWWLAAVGAVFLVVGPTTFAGVHFNRYLIWAFPGLLAFTAAGLGAATRLAAREDERLERALFRVTAGLLVVLGVMSTARFASHYGAAAGSLWRRDVAMARWIRTNLPPGVAIANVATSIEYLTGHHSLNLHGVMSAEFAGGSSLDRDANVLEQMRRLKPQARPPYLLVLRSYFEQSELMHAFADGEPLHSTDSPLDGDILLFRTRWDILDRGLDPLLPEATAAVAALHEVDRLDVGEPADEAAHAYSVDSRVGDAPLAATVAIEPAHTRAGDVPIADGGRLVLGGESFRVRHTRAGRDLVVVMRTRTPVETSVVRASGSTTITFDVREAGLVVLAGGTKIGPLRLANVEGWNEHVIRVPASAVADGSTELTLSGRYASYRYWFYQ